MEPRVICDDLATRIDGFGPPDALGTGPFVVQVNVPRPAVIDSSTGLTNIEQETITKVAVSITTSTATEVVAVAVTGASFFPVWAAQSPSVVLSIPKRIRKLFSDLSLANANWPWCFDCF